MGQGAGLCVGGAPAAGHHEDVWSDRIEPDESSVNRVSVIQGRGFNQPARVDGTALCVFLEQIRGDFAKAARMEGLIMSNLINNYTDSIHLYITGCT
jgi:hypothetical protein